MRAWGFEDAENAWPHEEYFDSLKDNSPPLRRLFDHARIACFGSENSSLLMWSHYADGLRGFCIGFDEEVLNSDPSETYFTDVEYMDTPPLVDGFLYAVASDQFDYHMAAIDERSRSESYLGRDPVTDEEYKEHADRAFELMTTIWRRAFAAKPFEWFYERERRLLIQTNSNNNDTSPVLHSYPISAVKQIIVGERMAKAYRARLLSIVAEHFPQLQVQCATRSRDAYTLRLYPLAQLDE